jgi:hypothetical protein
MAAGLGFKTFNTGDVLSAADTNGYLMQGVLVFASAAARDSAITSPQEGQFAYLKDTNVTTYYTGSAWANLDTTGMTNPMTTTGDTIYSSSGSTPARLGIGTAGQVLQVNSGATAPEWATPAGGGGMTLINSGGTTLSGASVSITSIPSTYKNLQLLIRNYKPATDTTNLRATFNSTTGYNGVYVGVEENRSPTGDADLLISRTQDNSVAQGVIVVQIFDYADTNTFKTMFTYAITNNATTSSNVNFMCGQSVFGSTTAISSIQIFPASGNFTSGTAFLYGVS